MKHKLYIHQPWYYNLPDALDELGEQSQVIAKVAERVMSSLGGLLNQQLLEEKGFVNAQA